MNKMILTAAVAIGAFAGTASFAQMNTDDPGMNSMSSKGSTGAMASNAKMSAADMKKMKACQAMSHDMMMKNAKCMKMMKMHPDMMNQTQPM